MKNHEIIMQYEGEMPILPAIEGVGYKPYPKYTAQAPSTEKVYEAETADKFAFDLARYIRSVKGVTEVRLYGNGDLVKRF